MNLLKKKFGIALRSGLIVTLLAMTSGLALLPRTANAAALSSLSDTLTTLTESVVADHEIFFVTPTGAQTTDTITLDFNTDGFTFAGTEDDVDIAEGTTNVCTSASYTEADTAASASATEWGVGVAANVITFSAPTAAVLEIDADVCVRIRIGTNAVTFGAGATGVTSPAVTGSEQKDIGIAGTFGDTGTLSVVIVDLDTVTITADVDQTIAFAISATALEYGTLASASEKWADASAGNATSAIGHTLTASHNGQSMAITVTTVNLVSQNADTITCVDPSAQSSIGTAEHGIYATVSGGNFALDANYGTGTLDTDEQYYCNTTTNSLATSAAASATSTMSMYYIANISATTPAGAYTETDTYIATGTF